MKRLDTLTYPSYQYCRLVQIDATNNGLCNGVTGDPCKIAVNGFDSHTVHQNLSKGRSRLERYAVQHVLVQLEQLAAQLEAENRPSRALRTAIMIIAREMQNGS